MIGQAQMFEPVFEILPDFRLELSEMSDNFQKGAAGWPTYLATAALAARLIGLLEKDEIETVEHILEIVDRWIVEGDASVRQVAIVGLIENLQNGNLHSTTRPEDFRKLLGPESRYWWKKVEKFWLRGDIIRDTRWWKPLWWRGD